MQHYSITKILATYLKVLMERSWAQKFKHQTIVTLKAENILKVQNILGLSVGSTSISVHLHVM